MTESHLPRDAPTPRERPPMPDADTLVRLDQLEHELAGFAADMGRFASHALRQLDALTAGLRDANERAYEHEATMRAALRISQEIIDARHARLAKHQRWLEMLLSAKGLAATALWLLALLCWYVVREELRR